MPRQTLLVSLIPNIIRPTKNSTVPRPHHNELPISHPIYDILGPERRAQISKWLEAHESTVGVLTCLFFLVLILVGIWRSRYDIAEWWKEYAKERERRQWCTRERERRRTSVVVGIMRNGLKESGYGDGGRAAEGGKRVRFAEEERETVVVDEMDEDRQALLVGCWEDGAGYRDAF